MAEPRIKQDVGGLFRDVFCSSPHPYKADVHCRRMPHTDGDHAAYTFSISTPETWQMEPPF